MGDGKTRRARKQERAKSHGTITHLNNEIEALRSRNRLLEEKIESIERDGVDIEKVDAVMVKFKTMRISDAKEIADTLRRIHIRFRITEDRDLQMAMNDIRDIVGRLNEDIGKTNLNMWKLYDDKASGTSISNNSSVQAISKHNAMKTFDALVSDVKKMTGQGR
jgi:hypothetical protein